MTMVMMINIDKDGIGESMATMGMMMVMTKRTRTGMKMMNRY